ncbi:hypothetical protein [Paenibacillus apiarius]
MKKTIAKFLTKRIEASAKKAAAEPKIVFGAKEVPNALKRDVMHG